MANPQNNDLSQASESSELALAYFRTINELSSQVLNQVDNPSGAEFIWAAREAAQIAMDRNFKAVKSMILAVMLGGWTSLTKVYPGATIVQAGSVSALRLCELLQRFGMRLGASPTILDDHLRTHVSPKDTEESQIVYPLTPNALHRQYLSLINLDSLEQREIAARSRQRIATVEEILYYLSWIALNAWFQGVDPAEHLISLVPVREGMLSFRAANPARTDQTMVVQIYGDGLINLSASVNKRADPRVGALMISDAEDPLAFVATLTVVDEDSRVEWMERIEKIWGPIAVQKIFFVVADEARREHRFRLPELKTAYNYYDTERNINRALLQLFRHLKPEG